MVRANQYAQSLLMCMPLWKCEITVVAEGKDGSCDVLSFVLLVVYIIAGSVDCEM